MIPKQLYDPDRVKVPLNSTNPSKNRGVELQVIPIIGDGGVIAIDGKMMELRNVNKAHKQVLKGLLYFFKRFCRQPADAAIGDADFYPIVYLVENVDFGAFMNNKKVNGIHGWGTFYGDGGGEDNGILMCACIIIILIGKAKHSDAD